MTVPITVELTDELLSLRSRWLEAERPAAFWDAEFGPRFAPLFAKLPLHGAPPDLERPRCLVSLLGFSPQPVALMAAWLNPEHMLILGTADSLKLEAEGALKHRIARVSGVSAERMECRVIKADDEVALYQSVREFATKHGARGHRLAVDATGGKKSMSIATGLAGFLEGALLVYVDYVDYDPERRVPLAGSEYPRLLSDPLQVLGDLEYERIRSAFEDANYREAERRSADLAARLYSPRPAEARRHIAAAYAAWSESRFSDAARELDALDALLRQHASRGGWDWANGLRALLSRQRPSLELLRVVGSRTPPRIGSHDEARALVFNHLASARRAIERARCSLALMLLYSTVERFVDAMLWLELGLDDEHPDYTLIPSTFDRAAYDRFGRSLIGDVYAPRPLEGPLMFTNGLMLLAALRPGLVDTKMLGPMRGLAIERNRCEFEHGLMPPAIDAARLGVHFDKVCALIAPAFGGASAVREALDALQFPAMP